MTEWGEGTFETIVVELREPAAIVRLNRPERRNAITTRMMAELADALTGLEAAGAVRGVVLTGSGDAFSTGADLNEAVAIRHPLESQAYNRQWRALTSTIERLRLPVIAAISGWCVTGGLEVALACDFRYADETARFAMTSVRLGSVAAAGGTQRLPRAIGMEAAKWMLLTGEYVDAAEAYRLGLVSRVVLAGTVVELALETVTAIARRAPLSVGWTKHAVNVGIQLDLESALDLEASLSAQAFATADKDEGMRAFLEKRDPTWTGR